MHWNWRVPSGLLKEDEMRKKVILSVAAHGDDAEFMAGGTLAKMVAEGCDLYCLIATDNDRGSYRLSSQELKTIARPEAEAAANVLGAREVFMLGYTDGDLCDVPASTLRGQIMDCIRKVRADVIFCWDPFAPFENHPDHRALAHAASDASSFSSLPLFHPEQLAEGVKPYRVTEWYWYSKAHWSTNKRVDISSTIEQKIKALYAYNCQMVLTIDDLLAEARAMGVDEARLAGIDATNFEPLIDIGVRANDAHIGAEIGVDYAEAFRYQTLELPEVFQV
jgi:N,N'-diacetylchitobiose non-reducing end deacetylase